MSGQGTFENGGYTAHMPRVTSTTPLQASDSTTDTASPTSIVMDTIDHPSEKSVTRCLRLAMRRLIHFLFGCCERRDR